MRLFLAAALAPIAVSAALLPFRADVAGANAVLVLVLVIVAVAAVGSRSAGALAALSAGAAYDYFFTEPYFRFAIADRGDVETAVLMLLAGVGVSEIAHWGRRQQALADRQAGYLAGIEAAASIGATGGSPSLVVDHVSDQLTRVLNLRGARFQYGVAGLGDVPRLLRDGRVVWHRVDVDVDLMGLPGTDIEVLVENGGLLCGRFLLAASAGSRPSLAQRLAAVTLADQVGAAMSRR